MATFFTRRLGGPSGTWAFVLSIISVMLSLNVLLSGTGRVTTASYMTVDTTNFVAPSKLASSVFLQDLSKVSNIDLVGQGSTGKSLGLSSTYDISLLTACGRAPETCFASQVGFAFDPEIDLKLNLATTTALPATYNAELRSYAALSKFIAIAYILAAPMTLLSCVLIPVASCRRPNRVALTAARVSSGMAAMFVLAAMIASIVTFVRLHKTFNDTFGDLGLKTTLAASAFGLGAAAMITSIAAFVLILIARPEQQQTRRRISAPIMEKIEDTAYDGGRVSVSTTITANNKDNNDSSKDGTSTSKISSAGRKILERVPSWNMTSKPRYVQVRPSSSEARLPTVHSRDPSPESDREALVAAVEYDSGDYHGDYYNNDDVEEELRGRMGHSAFPGQAR